MTLLYHECINIYTDASCKALNTALGEVQSTCPGFVATYQGRMIDSGLDVYIDEYAIFGEAKAIHMATNWVLYVQSRSRTTNGPTAYNIFSDSNAVVAKINGYLIKWFDLFKNGKVVNPKYTGSKGMASWDYLAYLSAVNILNSHTPVRLFYTPGHVSIWNTPFKGIDATRKKIVDLNNPYHGNINSEIEAYIVHEVATFNNIVDIMTRNYLYRNKYNMENSINACKDGLILGENKPCSIRWPFIIQANTPAAIQQPEMYMLKSRS